MRRIASHYIYWRRFYPMHYVELDDRGELTGVFPLEEEIAGTEFYDGILIPVSSIEKSPTRDNVSFSILPKETLAEALMRQGFADVPEIASPACILLLTGIPLTAAKLGADNCRCDGYIKRL